MLHSPEPSTSKGEGTKRVVRNSVPKRRRQTPLDTNATTDSTLNTVKTFYMRKMEQAQPQPSPLRHFSLAMEQMLSGSEMKGEREGHRPK